MTQANQTPDMHSLMFSGLIFSLSQAAMMQLGKIVNPETGRTEVQLDAAQHTIDMLDMLQTKTRGNLDPREERMLKELLTNLQLNYVETAQSQPQVAVKTDASPEATAAPAPAAEGGADDEPRFHKTYA